VNNRPPSFFFAYTTLLLQSSSLYYLAAVVHVVPLVLSNITYGRNKFLSYYLALLLASMCVCTVFFGSYEVKVFHILSYVLLPHQFVSL
jgi:hypothetical protein